MNRVRMIAQTIKDRQWQADTLTMVILSTVTGMAIEIGLAGYTIQQSAMIRLVAMIPNIATGGRNGQFINFVRSHIFRIAPRVDFRQARSVVTWPYLFGWVIRRIVADICAFTVFQIPLYILIQAMSTFPHVDVHKIIVSCGTLLPFAPILGIAYGVLLNLMRKIVCASEGFGLR